MKTFRHLLFGLGTLTAVCASAYDVWVPLGGAAVRTEAEADADFARVRGFDSHRPVFVLGVRERDPAVRAEQMKGLAANVRMAKARGLGPTAAWTWSFWCSSLDGFTPLTASDGWTSPQMACPLCPNFRAFAGDYLVEMAKCGVDMVLLDDDYRYGNLHDAELLCTCPLHMAKIEAILGGPIAPAELKRKALTGGKNRYRDAWMKVNGEALTDFAAFLRTRIDAVDPKIRIGLCAVMSHWDNDGVDAATTARILAGGTRPFLRLIGAPYWSVNRPFYDARLQNIIEFVRMERSWVTGDDIEIVSEGDTYPRPRQSCPASYLELYDLALRASGEVGGILKYGIDYYKPGSEDGYLVRHRKNRSIAAEIERAFGGKTAVGLRIYEKMKRLADVQIPEQWAGTTKIFELFGSEAAKYASDLGVPTVWQGEGIAGIAFGPNVEAVPAEARRRGLIVDAWGAWTLQQKGVDVGVRAFGAKYQAGVESGPFGLGGSTFAYEAYRIEPAQGAEVVEYDADGKTPAAFVYRNAAGERYMVLPHETYFNNPSWHRTYKAGRMLAKGVRMLTGRELPAFVGGNPDVYVVAKDGADGVRTVGVFNMYADELVDQPVELDREFAEVRFINCTGRLEGKRVILKSVPAWSFAGFEVKGASLSDSRTSGVEKREGFVRVEERDGRWTAVRSDGEPFTVLGVDHCQHWGMNCEDLGFSPYGKYVKEHYPSAEAWADETLGRLKSWGFTALGWGCDIRNLGHRGLVHTEYLNMGESVCTGSDPSRWRSEYKWAPGTAFPNVDHPDFPSACDAVAAKKCAASREDPDLLGYFIDNELNWWAACAHPHGRPDLEELARVADRYFAVTTAAIRRHDPNHLILGCRFAGFEGADEVVWKAAAKYCDVVTFNCYPWADLDRNVVLDRKGGVPIKERFDAFHKLVGRPLLVTEWSFPALDSGCPCLHGAGQRFRTQAQRTRASMLFARTLLSLPYVIGYNYFMWVDQPRSGLNHFFPEDSNYGLVSEENVPYQELTSMFARLQGEASRWRQAKIPAERTVKMLPKRTERERYIDAAKGSGEAVAFRREGADWTLSNDAGLVLRGTVGAGRDMVHAVILDGKSIGTLGGLVEMADNGERVWIDARDVKAVKCVQEGVAASVSVTAEGEGWNRRFALTLRYTLTPGRRDFVADIESLRNESDLPMPVAHLFLRPYAAEQPEGVVPQVPNLWKEPARTVWRLSNGITYGAESDDADIAFFNLHLESDGAMRPDVAFAPPNGLVLQPGAVYRPPRPMSARMIIGKEK